MKSEQIIVSLDGVSRKSALSLAWVLSPFVWGFKVHELVWIYGLDIIKELKMLGKVLVDSKLHNLPKVTARCVTKFAESGADYITVHATSGRVAMKASLENAGDAKILAVTILNGMKNGQVQESYLRPTEETVCDLAYMAYDCGVHGVVCSSKEINLLKHLNFTKVVSGTHGEANLYVVGKTITEAIDPVEALHQIVELT